MRVIKNILLVLLTLASISLYSQSDLDGTIKTDTTSGNFFNGGTAYRNIEHSGAGNYTIVYFMWDSIAMTSIGGSGFAANPTGKMTLYGKLLFNGFGAGGKEASDLGVTNSGYGLGVATDNTVIEVRNQYHSFTQYTTSDTVTIVNKSIQFIDSAGGTITFGLDPVNLDAGDEFIINVNTGSTVTIESENSEVFYTYDPDVTSSSISVTADSNIKFVWDGTNFWYDLDLD